MTDIDDTSSSSDAPARWATRAQLAAVLKPANANGLLLTSPIGDTVVPLSAKDHEAALNLARKTLTAAGVDHDDRVVIALNNDGELHGALLADAVTGVAQAVASVGPRGRMRLVKVLEAVGANVLITTPTGAADLLSRLHMEFLMDPLDLELRLLVLTGEITDAKTYRHLAAEFGAQVVELYSDPVLGLALAHRNPTTGSELVPAEPGLLALAALDRDEFLDVADTETPGEIVVAHNWHEHLGGVQLRTGYVANHCADGAISTPSHTVGDHVLVRGRWFSLTALARMLRKIDGITHWRFEVSRKGTLDSATLTVSFNRESLIRNGMWKSRIEHGLAALTPISITVQVDENVREEVTEPAIADHRGHHLGVTQTIEQRQSR